MLYSEIDIVRMSAEQKPIGLGKIRFETIKETMGTNHLATLLGDEDVGEIQV
jgi:hypothetical protein